MKTPTQKITFGAGCFWHVEYDFKKVKGVLRTTVGYMSADDEKSKKYSNPTYEEVCSDKTGFVEVCEIEFNPEEISIEELLKVFWKIHNPTQINRQGPDVGSQYKSVIFYYDSEQKKLAEESLRAEEKNLGKKIVTEIISAKTFYKAENYHQDYLEKKGVKSCRI
jgi:peptide-methionine (S)-S-oxide reductase